MFKTLSNGNEKKRKKSEKSDQGYSKRKLKKNF